MAKDALTLEEVHASVNDLANSIADVVHLAAASEDRLASRMDRGFTAVRHELSAGVGEMYRLQRETNERLEVLEYDSKTYKEDIQGLYQLITDLRQDVRNLTKNESQRLAELEAFAMQVAEKTGIPFNPKSKRRS